MSMDCMQLPGHSTATGNTAGYSTRIYRIHHSITHVCSKRRVCRVLQRHIKYSTTPQHTHYITERAQECKVPRSIRSQYWLFRRGRVLLSTECPPRLVRAYCLNGERKRRVAWMGYPKYASCTPTIAVDTQQQHHGLVQRGIRDQQGCCEQEVGAWRGWGGLHAC